MSRRPGVGGKRAGAGRPRATAPRRKKVTVKLTDDQHAAVKDAAAKEQRSVSSWCSAAFSLAILHGSR